MSTLSRSIFYSKQAALFQVLSPSHPETSSCHPAAAFLRSKNIETSTVPRNIIRNTKLRFHPRWCLSMIQKLIWVRRSIPIARRRYLIPLRIMARENLWGTRLVRYKMFSKRKWKATDKIVGRTGIQKL